LERLLNRKPPSKKDKERDKEEEEEEVGSPSTETKREQKVPSFFFCDIWFLSSFADNKSSGGQPFAKDSRSCYPLHRQQNWTRHRCVSRKHATSSRHHTATNTVNSSTKPLFSSKHSHTPSLPLYHADILRLLLAVLLQAVQIPNATMTPHPNFLFAVSSVTKRFMQCDKQRFVQFCFEVKNSKVKKRGV
jgi:hypothetical protein